MELPKLLYAQALWYTQRRIMELEDNCTYLSPKPSEYTKLFISQLENLKTIKVREKNSLLAKYNKVSRKRIWRIQRLYKLSASFIDLVDRGIIGIEPAVELSFLSLEQQFILYKYLIEKEVNFINLKYYVCKEIHILAKLFNNNISIFKKKLVEMYEMKFFDGKEIKREFHLITYALIERDYGQAISFDKQQNKCNQQYLKMIFESDAI